MVPHFISSHLVVSSVVASLSRPFSLSPCLRLVLSVALTMVFARERSRGDSLSMRIQGTTSLPSDFVAVKHRRVVKSAPGSQGVRDRKGNFTFDGEPRD